MHLLSRFSDDGSESATESCVGERNSTSEIPLWSPTRLTLEDDGERAESDIDISPLDIGSAHYPDSIHFRCGEWQKPIIQSEWLALAKKETSSIEHERTFEIVTEEYRGGTERKLENPETSSDGGSFFSSRIRQISRVGGEISLCD